MHEQPPIAEDVAIAENREQDQQTSLFEHLADEVFPFAGQQLTLRQIVDFCPVPASQRSFEKTELFTAKFAEQHGKVIPEQFAHLRSKPEDLKAQVPWHNSAVTERAKPTSTKLEVVASAPPKEDVLRTAKLEVLPTVFDTPNALEQQHFEREQLVVDSTHSIEPEAKSVHTKPNKRATNEDRLPRPRVKSSVTMPKPEAKAIKTPIPLQHVAANSVIHEPQPAREVPDPVQYLAKLYEAASREVEAKTTLAPQPEPEDYNHSYVPERTGLASNQAIIDVLDLTSRELYVPENAMLMLPEPTEPPLLSMLSIDTNEDLEPMHLEVEQPILALSPESVAEAYLTQLEALPTAKVEVLTELLGTITLVAERLQTLVSSERADSPEAQQIEAVLETYYSQLCQLLELPVDAEARRSFIKSIQTDAFQKVLETTFELPEDKGTHEFKRVMTQAHQIPVLVHRTINLARYMIGLRLEAA